MRRETLVENRPSEPLHLEATEVATLHRLGRGLASAKRWWGSGSSDDDSSGTAIELQHTPAGIRVTVRNAVGVIGTGTRTLAVEPKIPVDHFVYLMRLGGVAPRTDIPRTSIGASTDIWGIVANWYCTALGRLIRRDLTRDYRTDTDDLAVVRGRTDLLATSRNMTRGRLVIRSEYTEFDADTALNRILKAAIIRTGRSVALPRELRRTAHKLGAVFADVSDLQPSDLTATSDRRTAHYQDSLGLARLILAGRDLDFANEEGQAQTVLIPTPDLVESAIRRLLTGTLRPVIRVEKRGIGLRPTSLTLTPDLVFDGGRAVGDVKYTLMGSTWSRPHLYQATTFATGFGASKAVVIGFGTGSSPPQVRIGAVQLFSATWNYSVAPPESRRALVDTIASLLAPETTREPSLQQRIN